MGEKKSNLNNEKRQNTDSVKGDTSNQDEKKIIDSINEQNINLNEETSMKQSLSEAGDQPNSCDIKSLADKVTDINRLRFELDRLQLDFKARAYFENDIRPLIDTLSSLSYASINYAITATNMANTNFGHSSKIKNALELAAEVDDISEGLIDVLRFKVDKLIKLSKNDCK